MRTTDDYGYAVYNKKCFDYPETSEPNPNPRPKVNSDYAKCIIQEDDTSTSPTPMPYTDNDSYATPQKFKFRTA